MTQSVTLPPGKPAQNDARFIIKEIDNPRLASPCVKPGAEIDFQGGSGQAIRFQGQSPFDAANPTLGNTYLVRTSAPVSSRFTIEDPAYTEPTYEINVNSQGTSKAVFNYQVGKLRACQNTIEKVFFLRKEFNEAAFPGEIKLEVTQSPPGYSGPYELVIPDSQPNGYWVPGMSGSYVLQVVGPSSLFEHQEEVGSDEGDLVVDPGGG